MSATRISHAMRCWVARRTGQPVLAHHGIQRSGTNYLARAAADLGVLVVNLHSPDRAHPSHKHFRWAADKSAILPALRPEFGNSAHAAGIEDVNATAGFPSATRHVVMRKAEPAAITSLMNWGLRVGWFSDRDEALGQLEALTRDYRAYYAFWAQMARDHAGQVRLLSLEAVRADPGLLRTELRSLGFTLRGAQVDLRYSTVPMSAPDRARPVDQADVVAQARQIGLRLSA